MQLEDGRPHSKDHWQELIPHSPDVYIADISLFNEYLVINERSDGLQRIKIRSWDGSHEEFVHSDEAAYSMSLGTNLEQDTPWLRYHYTSLTTPHSVLEINMQSGEKRAPQATGGSWWLQTRGLYHGAPVVHRPGRLKNSSLLTLSQGS